MNLLRLGPEKRRNCTEVAESLQKLHANLQKDPGYGTHRIKTPPSRSPTLDSLLMEDDITPEFKRQIRTSLPKKIISSDREITSISAALCASPNSSCVNLVLSTGRDSRPSSPERKAKVRLSRELTPVQELPGAQTHEEPGKDQHSHLNQEATTSENFVPTDKGCESSRENATGLNIIDDTNSHPESMEEQHQRSSDNEHAQQAPRADNTVAEVATTDRGLHPGSKENDAAVKGSPSEPSSATSAEEQTNRDRGKHQPVLNATTFLKTDVLNQPSHATGGFEGEHEDLSRSTPRVVGKDEHLEVPQGGGEGRTSSDSTTVFQDTSDVGKEDAHDHHARDPSQTGSHGREKKPKHTDTTESVMEDERVRDRWFKSILKKIPCFK